MSSSNFQQSLDKSRPHSLIESKIPAHKSHQLTYRYGDNGELVTVPNCSYNQTAACLAQKARAGLKLLESDRAKVFSNPFLSDSAKQNMASRIDARIALQQAKAEALDLDALNSGMGVYSCGNPEPDRVHFSRTHAAWSHYLSIKPSIEQLFCEVSNMETYYKWQDALQSAQDDLQRAFYFDTSDINSRDNCRMMTIEDIQSVVISKSKRSV